MENKSTKSQTFNLEIDTQNLNDQQVRLIKRVNAMLAGVMTSEYEDEYFDASSELIKIVAMAIKTSNFNDEDSEIAHDQQVLEYCADLLSDQVYQDKVTHYDN